MSQVSFYAPLETSPMPLGVAPRLASWNRADHHDQLTLREFLTHAEAVLRPELARITGAAALRLDVGLPVAVPLIHEHDLDNYLYPLTRHLSAETGVQLV